VRQEEDDDDDEEEDEDDNDEDDEDDDSNSRGQDSSFKSGASKGDHSSGGKKGGRKVRCDCDDHGPSSWWGRLGGEAVRAYPVLLSLSVSRASRLGRCRRGRWRS
jgi:hypothetical protein